MAKISDEELLSICLSEIENSTGYVSGELSNERADAMDRYLGEPYGNEIEGRSQFRTREVLETVEGILPSLVRIFMETDNIVIFEPTGPEDEELAEQQTDVVNHIYFSQNRAFYNTYSFLKDCLLSKTGIMKIWAETDRAEEREEYENLDPIEYMQLMNDSQYEREPTEYEETMEGINVVFKTTKKAIEINVEPCPPEEFGVNGDARTPYAKDAQFVFHRARKTFTQLVAEGYDKAFLESLPANDDIETEERLARRHLTDESDLLSYGSDEVSMRTYWITECYLHVDRDDDGISELIKCTIAAGAYSGAGGRLMDVEEVDRIPFVTASPNILTHKFYGLSIADVVVDLQEIQTTLMRQVLDNTYLANNGQTAVNTDFVNEDDMLTRWPGGLVRFDGSQPWNAVVGPIPHNQLPQQTSELFERLDERQKRRTGYGDEVAGLDASALSNVNTGVAALAFDQARMKIELIARIIAELAFKPMMHDIHELLMKHQDKEMVLKLRGEWVPMNPSEWKTRENSTVQIGIGKISRERKLMGYEAIMAKQAEDVQMGGLGMIVMPEHLYEVRKKWVKAWGFDPSEFFQDPRQLPPPEPQQDPQADALMMQAQALMMDAETKRERNQIDMAKMQAEMQLKAREQDLKLQEQELKAEIEQMKAQLSHMKTETETDTKVASLELQMDKQNREAELKRLEMTLEQVQAEKDRDVDLYKIQTDNLVKLMQSRYGVSADPEMMEARETEEREEKEMSRADIGELKQWVGTLMATNQELSEKLEAMDKKQSAPKVIKRDATGLIVDIGGQSVVRDESGRVIKVG